MTIDRLAAALADRYTIERELGQGGMATVYLAHDIKHDRKVAVKVLRPELAAVIGAERFLVEIKTTANLLHPHILALFDSGQVDGTVFYVMPFVEGESLRDRITREKQLPIDDALRIAREVADALQYAHEHAVIHRDIKPENILLHGGHALVADFGIALAASKTGGTRMTETGMSLGTPHYMSPEQAMGERDLDARTDIYALGCVTYEMLVGDPPFTASTAQGIVAKVMTEKPASIIARRDRVPEYVEDAVLTALQKLPADRFDTAAEYAAALAGGSTTRTTTRATPQGPAGMGWGWRLINTGLIVIALASVWALTHRPTATGPTVYDASVPDSALVSLSASPIMASYGTSMRNMSVSGQGDFAVYVAKQGDSTALWYRSLQTADAHLIAGTTGATAPRISPNGSMVAYLLGDQVMVIPISGGAAKRLLEGIGTTWLFWTANGQLMVADQDGTRLSWLDPNGAAAQSKPITRCGFSGVWIESLKQLLCSVNRLGTFVDPESGKSWLIRFAGTHGAPGKLVLGSSFRFIDGYLVYIAVDGSMVAAKFDPATHIAGKAVALLSGVRREAIGDGQYDIAANGSLVYVPGVDATNGRMVVLHSGKEPEPLPIESSDYQRFDLSRDGRWFAATVQGAEVNELRQYDLRNGQHLTWLRGEYLRHPLWDPAGDKLIIAVRELNNWYLLKGSPNSGAPPDTLLMIAATPNSPDPTEYHDEHLALAQDWTGSVVFRFDPSASHAVFDTVLTGARFASVSPRGNLILYQTLESNRVIVTSFPKAGHRWQLASDGAEPLWLSDTEALFRRGVSWQLVHVNPETGEPLGPSAFWGRDPRFSDTPGWSNRPSHDGGILYVQSPAQVTANHLRVVPNWVAQMKAVVDAGNR